MLGARGAAVITHGLLVQGLELQPQTLKAAPAVRAAQAIITSRLWYSSVLGLQGNIGCWLVGRRLLAAAFMSLRLLRLWRRQWLLLGWRALPRCLVFLRLCCGLQWCWPLPRLLLPPLLSRNPQLLPPVSLSCSQRRSLCTPVLFGMPPLVQLLEKELAGQPGGRRNRTAYPSRCATAVGSTSASRSSCALGANSLNVPCCRKQAQQMPLPEASFLGAAAAAQICRQEQACSASDKRSCKMVQRRQLGTGQQVVSCNRGDVN